MPAHGIPTAEDLLALPIDGLPDEIVSIAERLAAAPVGLYVVDLEGVALRRLAGASALPGGGADPADGGAGDPDRPSRGARARFRRARDRDRRAALAAAPRDRRVPRRWARPAPRWTTSPRAPPAYSSCRSATPTGSPARGTGSGRPPAPSCSNCSCRRGSPGIRGAEIAGSVLPAYDVGGDWFEHIADRGGAWLAVADAAGKGPRASAVSRADAGRAARDARGRADRSPRPPA